jgi:hypothetical protein
LLAGSRASKGERWRGGYSSAESGYVCSPEIYEADIVALREEHPGLVSFEQYLRPNGWENAEAHPKG